MHVSDFVVNFATQTIYVMKMGVILIVLGILSVVAGSILVFRSSTAEEGVGAPQVVARPDGRPDEPVASPAAKAAQTSQSAEKPVDNKSKGNSFEAFVADMLKSNSLRIKEWNQGTTSPGGAWGENELKPDFLIGHDAGKITIEYWAECKFRSSVPTSGFQLEDYQLKRYKEIQGSSRKKVLIVLGVGGEAASPDRLYVVPLDSLARFKHIPQKYLDGYAVSPSDFGLHVRNWFFNEVFKK